MSKILDASCVAGIVTVDSLPIPSANILSQGVKASTGKLLMDEEKADYFTSNATDIADLISNIGTVVDQIVLALTALDAVTVSPGSATAAITLVTTLKATLVAQGAMLK